MADVLDIHTSFRMVFSSSSMFRLFLITVIIPHTKQSWLSQRHQQPFWRVMAAAGRLLLRPKIVFWFRRFWNFSQPTTSNLHAVRCDQSVWLVDAQKMLQKAIARARVLTHAYVLVLRQRHGISCRVFFSEWKFMDAPRPRGYRWRWHRDENFSRSQHGCARWKIVIKHARMLDERTRERHSGRPLGKTGYRGWREPNRRCQRVANWNVIGLSEIRPLRSNVISIQLFAFYAFFDLFSRRKTHEKKWKKHNQVTTVLEQHWRAMRARMLNDHFFFFWFWIDDDKQCSRNMIRMSSSFPFSLTAVHFCRCSLCVFDEVILILKRELIC